MVAIGDQASCSDAFPLDDAIPDVGIVTFFSNFITVSMGSSC